MPLLTDSLQNQPFSIFLEYLPTKHAQPVPSCIAGYPVTMTIADRVRSDDDPEPLAIAQNYAAEIPKILHFSGKGRDIADFNEFIRMAQVHGYSNVLLLTGDKLKHHQNGQDINFSRTRYLESVNAVMQSKKLAPAIKVGVALNPFKYAKAEHDAQYYKLDKKVLAGADYVVTQLGFDLDALKEAKQYLENQHSQVDLFACVMPLTAARAEFMVKQKVAGIVLPPHLLQLLKQEQVVDAALAEQNVYARCALQILICRYWGFAGVHLSACHKPEEQQKLEQALNRFRDLSFDQCMLIWSELHQLKSGDELKPKPDVFQKKVSPEQVLKYKSMQFMHDSMFDSKIARNVGSKFFNPKLWSGRFANKLLIKSEYLSKHGVVGCESCGQCRLADTLYICPETCPKGLANGPCGGTTFDRCEFGDRECIHSVKARLAQQVNQIEVLKTRMIDTVPIESRGTSSWVNWFNPK
ncbi:methylenetetrahydrofolate reductase C-terminal domain-containing protein [Acinetobacter sp. ANC 4173]|uniref:methylenetetrahydrofolate reductase C-terminal domain-containing protein n=1 Tax=Acinetobacter sp. ANC 4173 TaxID=2529837 RepID=UPI00103D92D0|nr:methylenetetrahydrofolate reductase C-terminal domain-containing protein [Acinetobacter sp. ANC 4173]TCB79624.1 methylenetetrahydrofolate reductase [Acinetobacter sp. ANC 4173]